MFPQCDQIQATSFYNSQNNGPQRYTGQYGQSVVITLPGANNRNLVMLSDGTPGFSTRSSPYFTMEYHKPNPNYTVPNRIPDVVYLTDYFFIKTLDTREYVTKLPKDYRYTMTTDRGSATPFYLFQKHSMYYNHDAAGYTWAEKNDSDDGLRYLRAIVTNINGPNQDIMQNGWQWKTTSPDYNHFVDNSQSQWNDFTYVLS